MKAELRLHPFSQIPVPNYAVIDGATVRIDTNYAPGLDKLFFDYQGAFGIYSTFDANTGVLYLAGFAPVTEYLDAITSVVFYTSSDDFQSRRLVWTLGRGNFYNVLTRHYYRFVSAIGASGGAGTGWNSAVYNCQVEKYLGMQGYLATITSYEEQLLISTKTNMSMWIALWANGTQWQWGAGPEMGQIQYNGFSMYEGGTAAPGRVEPAFTSWGRFQPEDYRPENTGRLYVAADPSPYEPVAWWKNMAETDGVQGYVCEYGGMDSQDIIDLMPSWNGAVILEFSCINYTTGGDCLNHASYGCAWNGRSCQQISCRAYLSEKECDGDFRCEWLTDITATQTGRCSATKCGAYASQDTCNVDVSCTTSLAYGTARCLDAKCSDKLQSCHCAQVEGCIFHDSVCDASVTLGCDNFDVIFVFDGSQVMSQNFLTFSGGYQGLTDLFMEAQFSTTRTPHATTPSASITGQRVGFVRFGDDASYPPEGVGSWGEITGDYLEISTDLTFFQQGWVPSATRNIRQALAQAQTMFAAPDTVNREKVLVIMTGGGIADASGVDAQAALTSMRASGVAIVGAVLRPTQPATNDSIAGSASLLAMMPASNILNIELDDVLNNVIYGICNENATLGQVVVQTSKSFQCSSVPTASECNKVPICGWSYSAGICEQSHCLQYCGATECAVDPTCAWDSAGLLCKEKCPGQTKGQCNGYSTMCWYDEPTVGNASCRSMPCMNNPTEDACIADPYGCIYNASSPIKCKPIMCRTTNMTECEVDWASQSCLSYKGQCFFDPCQVVARDSTLCVQNPACAWTGSTTGCQATPCGNYRSERHCNGDFDCAWNITVSPPTCMAAKCTGYNKNPSTAPLKCSSMPGTCQYTPATSDQPARCELLTCNMMKKSCDCAKLSQCVWRNDQCKESTYVQCPAIDIVFVVEGSPLMNNAFGRHPNGFVGIIESIRSWSRAAPMTTNVSQTGFRMGMILYGAANLAQTVPDGVANGNDLTGDPNKWLGAGQVLDTMEDKQVVYSNSTGDQAAIWKGLEAAVALYQKHIDETRIKLVVVLGNSPITDGGRLFQGNPLVRQQIEKLEQMGVRIMANVIRRFSSVTPLDEVSRQYMEPLASDPASTFFTFTTIDDLRTNLLDKFCDPSTNTGKLLQISRDRTLPCSWLVGQRECNMQPTCFWNASKLPTCATTTQCPNMGCIEFPALLAKKFSCEHCQYKNGAFICNRANNYQAKRGMCMQTPCLDNCNVASCNAVSTCTWNAGSTRCERSWCGTYTTWDTCDADSGCVWQEIESDPNFALPSCRPSRCWANRAYTSCSSQVASYGYDCIWQPGYSPAVCEQRRCDALNQAACVADDRNCKYNGGAPGRKCTHRDCAYPNGEECEIDSTCYWDPYQLRCKLRTINCDISSFSPWTPCTSTCGQAIRYRVRKIVQFPSDDPNAIQCPVALNNINDGQEKKMIQTQVCGVDVFNTTWPNDCTAYCLAKGSLTECLEDVACQWQNGQCEAKLQVGCELKSSEQDCTYISGTILSDSCVWDTTYKFCFPDVGACQFDKSSQCSTVSTCAWRNGPLSVAFGANYGISDVSLYNPGQLPMFVFPLLQFDQAEAQTTYISGATVLIEQGYALGKDKLDLQLPVAVAVNWDPARGALVLSGNASVAQYGYAIHFVTFQTTSTTSNPRLITWSLLNGTVYSGVTNHHYARYNEPGIGWAQAQIGCQNTVVFGWRGYLATILTEEENSIIATKLGGDGWIGGSDATAGTWSWATGPEAGQTFWYGGCAACGGQLQTGMFANWDPVRRDPIPALIAQQNNVYLNLSGYWHSRFNEYPQSVGYVCEYGGLSSDVQSPFPTGGSTVFGPGGCVATPCVWHADAANCQADQDCQWAAGKCSAGCNARSTVSQCMSSDRCFWNTQVLPPVCSMNPCSGLGTLLCPANSKCIWNKLQSQCVLKTGCMAESDQVGCEMISTCMWYSDTDGCINRPCNIISQQTDCMLNSFCKWVSGTCISAVCQYTDSATCGADAKCEWTAPDAISMGFTPSQGSIHPFSASSAFTPADDSTIIDGITIVITSGYQSGTDTLFLDPLPLTMATFKSSWNANTGTLVLTTFATAKLTPLTGFQMMQQYVSFSTTSTRRAPRQISYVLSANAIFSSATRSFYKYVPTKMEISTRADAEGYCNSINFFGLTGTLAQPIRETDNLLLRTIRAQGWMGARATGGVWQWNESTVTTTANTTSISYSMTTFWTYANGYGQPVPLNDPNSVSTYRFAAWGPSQPAAPASASAFQSGFIAQDGSWMSVTDGMSGLLPGVICQFGSAVQPVSVIVSSSATAVPVGCFPLRCVSLGQAQCVADPQCVWTSDNQCVVDSWCAVDVPLPLTVTQCEQRAGCFWDYKNLMCLAAPVSACTGTAPEDCDPVSKPGCVWNSKLLSAPGAAASVTIPGACVAIGCRVHPLKETCLADPLCRWYMPSSVVGAGSCIERLCGYTSIESCYQDTKCQWNLTVSSCVPSVCLGSASCTSMPQCKVSTTVSGLCEYVRCSAGLSVATAAGRTECLSDTSCLVLNGKCAMPNCAQYYTESTCNADKNCFFFIQSKAGGMLQSRCDAAQCTMNADRTSCGGTQPSDPCRWDATTGGCRQASAADQIPGNTCIVEVSANLWWMYVLIPVIIILLGLIIWRMWIAYDRGISFLEPPRKTRKFDLSMYAADMFEDAQDRDMGGEGPGGDEPHHHHQGGEENYNEDDL